MNVLINFIYIKLVNNINFKIQLNSIYKWNSWWLDGNRILRIIQHQDIVIKNRIVFGNLFNFTTIIENSLIQVHRQKMKFLIILIRFLR